MIAGNVREKRIFMNLDIIKNTNVERTTSNTGNPNWLKRFVNTLANSIVKSINFLFLSKNQLINERDEIKSLYESRRLSIEVNNQMLSIEVEDLTNQYIKAAEECSSVYETLQQQHDELNKIENELADIRSILLSEENLSTFKEAAVRMSGDQIEQLSDLLDSDGWLKLRVIEKTLNYTTRNLYRDLIVEDNMGRFENSDGNELISYIENIKFANQNYEIIGGTCCEATHFDGIDKSTDKYQDYVQRKHRNLKHELRDLNLDDFKRYGIVNISTALMYATNI